MADTPTSEQEQQQAEEVDFEPITSQEDLDRRIGPRLERERAKFADYAELQEKAARLAEIEEANKTEADKAAERLAAAEAEVQQVPTKVAASLREHLVAIHEIDQETADLFLTASDPERLMKQVQALVSQRQEKPRAPRPNAAQNGGTPTPQGDWLREQLART